MKGVIFLSVFIFFMGIYTVSLNYNEGVEASEDTEYTLCDLYKGKEEECEPVLGYYSRNVKGGEGEAEVFFMTNCDDVPEEFILECIGGGSIPYIIIEGKSGIFDRGKMERIARELGYFNENMYIELYPVYTEPAFNERAYGEFFREVYCMFKEYAPKTEIIWAVSADVVYGCERFYPGDEYIDYVGFEMLLGVNGKWDCFENELSYISYRYKKPIFITRLGATAYSESSHRYFTNERKKYINGAMEMFNDLYEVEGIIIFETEEFEYGGKSNKISFLENEEIYKAVMEWGEKFKKRRERVERLNFTANVINENAFVDYEVFEELFGSGYTAVYINGEKLVNLNSYSDGCYIFIEKRAVILEENVV